MNWQKFHFMIAVKEDYFLLDIFYAMQYCIFFKTFQKPKAVCSSLEIDFSIGF